MKRVYYFFVNCGEVVFIWSLIFIISISLQSVVIRGQINYGERCYQTFNDEFIKNYNYDGITLNYGRINCNTYYLEYSSVLEEKQNLNFLVSISKLLHDYNVDIDTHIIIKNEHMQILATIVNYQVTYTKSNI